MADKINSTSFLGADAGSQYSTSSSHYTISLLTWLYLKSSEITWKLKYSSLATKISDSQQFTSSGNILKSENMVYLNDINASYNQLV